MEATMQYFFFMSWRKLIWHLLAPLRLVQALFMVLTGRRPTEEETTKAGEIMGLGIRSILGQLIEEEAILWVPGHPRQHWHIANTLRVQIVVRDYFRALSWEDKDLIKRVQLELGMDAWQEAWSEQWDACLEATHENLLEEHQ